MAEVGQTDGEARANLKRQVADTLRAQIESGVYRPGDKLPSIRELGRSLKISVTTVIGAYAILEIDGLIVVHRQSGIYVRLRRTPAGSPIRSNPPATPVLMMLREDMEVFIRPEVKPRPYWLSSGAPNADLLPTKSMNAVIKKVAVQFGDVHMHYSEPRGALELREQIAQQAMIKGCVLDPQELVITNGCTEALMIALRIVAAPGDIVAVESPGYPGLLNALKSQNLRILEVPSFLDDGMDISVLEALLQEHPIAAVFATPNFGNPLGSLMPLASRQRLVEILAEREIPLIEDDIYSDLSYDQRPVPPCKSFDRKGLVLHCSSFSKSLSPGLRVGWMAAGRFVGSALTCKVASTYCTSLLSQTIIGEFLREHRYSLVVAKAAAAYRKNVGSMVACVKRNFPAGSVVTEPSGGFLVWIQMPEGIESRHLLELSLNEGISFDPGYKYSAHALYCNRQEHRCHRGGCRTQSRFDGGRPSHCLGRR